MIDSLHRLGPRGLLRRATPSGARSRRWVTMFLMLMVGTPGAAMSAQAATAVQTIVFLRHGEKPAAGLGQLDCRGLNRALALPRVIATKFGRPDLIVAPNPSIQKKDAGIAYDYVRPLATIEPTAIRFGLPITSAIGFAQTDALRNALLVPHLHRSLIVVAWEHRMIEVVARDIVQRLGGDPASVPAWHGHDFDSLYVIRITRTDQQATVTFVHDHENLDNMSDSCPE